MRVYFNNIDVKIQGSGILAESASISSKNSTQPVFTVGKIGQRGNAPFGPLTCSYNFSYFPELDNEPNRFISNTIKDMTNDLYSGVDIEVGGFSGSNCYLTRYNLEADANDPVRATANFISFGPISGAAANKLTTAPFYNRNNYLAHGWSVYITDTGDFLTPNPTYNFSYSFDCNWNPVYIMGQTKPCNIRLMSATENVAFTRDVLTHILHSGVNLSSYLETTGDCRMLNIEFAYDSSPNTLLPSIRIPVSGFSITTSEIQAQTDDFLRIRTIANRSY